MTILEEAKEIVRLYDPVQQELAGEARWGLPVNYRLARALVRSHEALEAVRAYGCPGATDKGEEVAYVADMAIWANTGDKRFHQ